jgi:hypothetical protein
MVVYHESGGCAFPSDRSFGMTLRDYFAAQAMQGMLAACTGWSEQGQTRLAKCSYMMADQMLKERESDE